MSESVDIDGISYFRGDNLKKWKLDGKLKLVSLINQILRGVSICLRVIFAALNFL